MKPRLAILASLLTVGCSSDRASGPVAPVSPDPGPANPDAVILVRTEQTRYVAPAHVQTWVKNESSETRLWWAQCLPNLEVWRNDAWQGLASTCTGDAVTTLGPGDSLLSSVYVGVPGFYRTVIPVSSEPNAGLLVYRSQIWVVQ